MVNIRRAGSVDIPWISKQLVLLDNFYGSKHKLFRPSLVKQQIESVIDKHLFLISENSKPTGLMAGFVTSHPYNPEIRCLTETTWWVTPEYRNGRSANLLLRAFIDWGRKNVDWITLSLPYETPIKPDRLKRFGFQPRERSFLMEIT